jgi:hypothetical protein
MYRIISHLLEWFVSLQTSFKCLSITGWYTQPTTSVTLCESMCSMGLIFAKFHQQLKLTAHKIRCYYTHLQRTTCRWRCILEQAFSFYTIWYFTVLYLYIPCHLCPILPAPENMLKHKVEWNKAWSRILKVTLNAAASFPTGSTFADFERRPLMWKVITTHSATAAHFLPLAFT